jgi:hypothetical protein
MDVISIGGTKLTPSIILDAKNGWIEIEGNSIMDDATEFYKTILEFVKVYSTKPSSKTVVKIKLNYITLPSSKCILELLKTVESIHKKDNCKVVVNWYYTTNEMLNAGKDYQSIIKLPFNMIEE